MLEPLHRNLRWAIFCKVGLHLFLRTVIDYAVQFLSEHPKGESTNQSRRSSPSSFVCTRTVHIETVYMIAAFLAAFRCFTSRRELCTDIYSDCGTNFVGANKALRDLFRASSSAGQLIAHTATADGIKWHFNPPAAPHFGGLWAAAVKSTKYHLRRSKKPF